MQLFKIRIVSAILSVIVFTSLFCFTGCAPKKDPAVEVQDSTETQVTQATIAKKRKKVTVPEKPIRSLIAACVKARIDHNIYDSLVIEITTKRGNKSTNFAQVTFAKGTPDWASIRFNDKGKLDILMSATWYKKGDKTPYEDDLCEQNGGDCVIPGAYKCSDLATPVVSVKTTTGGASTATVSIDED